MVLGGVYFVFLTVYWIAFCYVLCGWVSAAVERDKEKKLSDWFAKILEREGQESRDRIEAIDQYSRKKLDLYGEEVRQLEMEARRILVMTMKMNEKLKANEDQEEGEEEEEEEEDQEEEEQTSCFTTVRFNRRL